MGEHRRDLDALARALATRGETRRALVGTIGGMSFLAPVWAADAAAKRKKKKKKKRCKFSPKCDGQCCSPETCFEKVGVSSGVADAFECCPPNLLSLNPGVSLLPDQCCYPDETPKPELASNSSAQMLCCRPCANIGECGDGWADGCIIQPQYECLEGVCQSASTARLPRLRRP